VKIENNIKEQSCGNKMPLKWARKSKKVQTDNSKYFSAKLNPNPKIIT
jgi:hypothetical protein